MATTAINKDGTLRKERPVLSLAERVWAKVDKTPGHGPNGDCWLWTGEKNKQGYGVIMVANPALRNGWGRLLAHRATVILSNGEIPNQLCVCHKCDNPSCVRPSHLFLGTIQDNNADRTAKGRTGMKKITRLYCRRGHKMFAGGAYITSTGRRVCRECTSLLRKQSYKDGKAQLAAG